MLHIDTQRARLADTKQDFKNAGIDPVTVAPWEDGMRVDPVGGNYEWWYFDTNLSDGSQMVITFHAKSFVDPLSCLNPNIDINLTRPDGSVISDNLLFEPGEFTASKNSCDVKIGKNYFKGDLQHYELGVFSNKITARVSFENITPAWRQNYCIYFGDTEENNFSWLPATPRGTAKVALEFNNHKEELRKLLP